MESYESVVIELINKVNNAVIILNEVLETLKNGGENEVRDTLIYSHAKPIIIGEHFLEAKTLTLPRAFEKYMGLKVNEKAQYDVDFNNEELVARIRYYDRKYKSSRHPYMKLTLNYFPLKVKYGERYKLQLYKTDKGVKLIFRKL